MWINTRIRVVWYGILGLVMLFVFGCLRHDIKRWSPVILYRPLVYGKVYIITRSYGGQMTRAIKNMLDQQCWAGTFRNHNVSVVEPFSTKSQLLHLPTMWNELKTGQLRTAAKFSDYYNLNYYNLQSVKHKSAMLISWDDFLANAPRRSIAVSIPTQKCNGVEVDLECVYSKSFQVFIDSLINRGFDVVKTLCFTCSTSLQSFQLNQLIDIISDGTNTTDISIFIDSWRNFAFTSSWIQIPDYCKFSELPETLNFLVPSPSVVNHSQYYMKRFIKSTHFIGIMLRIERFLTLVNSDASIESCLNKTLSVFYNIRSPEIVSAYITVDIGKYGSGVMQKEGPVSRFGKGSIQYITKLVESVLQHLYNSTLKFEDWENTFVNATGGIVERGYVAMLQRNIASHSDCLILMGGGSFQQVAAFQYITNILKKQKNPCIHTVCASANFNKLFMNTSRFNS